ncbi:MAG: antibiotic biosynthesis monooxygenase [Flavobacteriaceae bacterium]|nr:antibiotic biosynthesis monooxygenase [Flavobacteriaceae bacterium]
MLIRVVKLTIKEEKSDTFATTSKGNREKILAFPGCKHLEMYRDIQNPQLFITYSHWEDESALNNYRNSALFKSIWATVKPMFAEKAMAWSVQTY